jgi:cell division protein FtsQ
MTKPELLSAKARSRLLGAGVQQVAPRGRSFSAAVAKVTPGQTNGSGKKQSPPLVHGQANPLERTVNIQSAKIQGATSTGSAKVTAEAPKANQAKPQASAQARLDSLAMADQHDVKVLRWVLWSLIIILAVVIAGQVFWQMVIAPTLRIEYVDLANDMGLDELTVLKLAGLPDRPLYDSVDEQTIKEQLESYSIVKSARVERIFPDTLRINVLGRKPLVQNVMADGTVVLIDDEGYVYDYVRTFTAYDIPVLSGLEFRNFSMGTRLPDSMLPFIADLAKLRDEQTALFQAFSEFRLETRGGQDLEILCLPSRQAVPVRIGSRLSIESAIHIMRVLQALAGTEGFAAIRELDYRSRDLIIKKGES